MTSHPDREVLADRISTDANSYPLRDDEFPVYITADERDMIVAALRKSDLNERRTAPSDVECACGKFDDGKSCPDADGVPLCVAPSDHAQRRTAREPVAWEDIAPLVCCGGQCDANNLGPDNGVSPQRYCEQHGCESKEIHDTSERVAQWVNKRFNLAALPPEPAGLPGREGNCVRVTWTTENDELSCLVVDDANATKLQMWLEDDDRVHTTDDAPAEMQGLAGPYKSDIELAYGFLWFAAGSQHSPAEAQFQARMTLMTHLDHEAKARGITAARAVLNNLPRALGQSPVHIEEGK